MLFRISLLVISVFTMACAPEHRLESKLPSDPLREGTDSDNPPPPVTFRDLQPALIDRNSAGRCAQCHTSLESYEGFVARIDRSADAIFNNRMPLGAPPVSEEIKALLQRWIDDGMQP